jgi:plasmid stability protein
VLVTTRRHDTALATHGRQVIDVGLFTHDEARGYLTAKLSSDQVDQADLLAAGLGYLPLALAQAAAVMAEQGWSCADYRTRLADQRRRLALPPDYGVSEYRYGWYRRPYPICLSERMRLSIRR